MALLYRHNKLKDRHNTAVFTFIVTKTVTRDLHRDTTSKEFMCGCHKWALTFTHTDYQIGTYLVWKNPSECVRIFLDLTFNIINRKHFSSDETFTERQVKFSHDYQTQGTGKFVLLSDLQEKNFMDQNGEFLLEVIIGSLRTVYNTEFRVPSSANKNTRLESRYFNYGGFEWSIVLYPHTKSGDGKMRVSLQRLTGFDHQCHVRYDLVLGKGERRVDSGIFDDISDLEGNGLTWHPHARYQEIADRHMINVHLELFSAYIFSDVLVSHNVNSPSGQCYDRDMNPWFLDADADGEFLRLRLVYRDVHNIPKNHLR